MIARCAANVVTADATWGAVYSRDGEDSKIIDIQKSDGNDFNVIATGPVTFYITLYTGWKLTAPSEQTQTFTSEGQTIAYTVKSTDGSEVQYSGNINLVIPQVTMYPDTLWYFNGEKPKYYINDLITTLTVSGIKKATFSWTVKVKSRAALIDSKGKESPAVESTTASTIKVKALRRSDEVNDTIVVLKCNDVSVTNFAITVYAPKTTTVVLPPKLDELSPAMHSYVFTYKCQILNNVMEGGPLPKAVEVNETFAPWIPINNGNWDIKIATVKSPGITTADGILTDTYGVIDVFNVHVPAVGSGSDAAGQEFQNYFCGSKSYGKGFMVKRHNIKWCQDRVELDPD